MNEDTWNHNDVDKIWSKSKKAHVFVGRTGKSTSPVGFDTPWRATKYEFKAPPALAAKGLFIHIELVQPRRAQAGKWAGNDIIAPEHGFTLAQYDRLALLYLTASLRADNWLIPGFHACIDDGIKEAHDDPQNFDLDAFDAALKSLMSAFSSEDETENMNFTQLDSLVLWATYYYVPSVEHDSSGISVLDASENETGFRLSKCDWCNAAIQGTVVITKDGKASTLNYAGRSDTIQYDCRKCALYANYDGYEKTGKVLWTPSSGYGLGVNNYKLVPFKTIAVEEDVIPIGSAVFIPRADGIEFTDSDGNIKVHDGYFFAGDVGSKIAGTHIDVFIGDALVNPFDFVQSNAYKTFKAYIVTDTAIIEELRSLHK
ncbi:MAG: 3D (Asp-Asp-Asp) domain-containing protein [Crocinitomicaceae bacterium]